MAATALLMKVFFLYKTLEKNNCSFIFYHLFGIFFVPREAALAADLITARKPSRGGCASSRLIHGFPGDLKTRQSELFQQAFASMEAPSKKNLEGLEMSLQIQVQRCLLYTSPSPRD